MTGVQTCALPIYRLKLQLVLLCPILVHIEGLCLKDVVRRQGEVILDEISFSDLKLNLSNYMLECGDKSIHLGFKEFEIMKILLSNPKSIVQKEDILTKVWGYDSDAEDNNVEVYISFIRKKLVFLGSKVTVSTVRKIGYHLEESK